jgi:hypothetical protein
MRATFWRVTHRNQLRVGGSRTSASPGLGPAAPLPLATCPAAASTFVTSSRPAAWPLRSAANPYELTPAGATAAARPAINGTTTTIGRTEQTTYDARARPLAATIAVGTHTAPSLAPSPRPEQRLSGDQAGEGSATPGACPHQTPQACAVACQLGADTTLRGYARRARPRHPPHPQLASASRRPSGGGRSGGIRGGS